MHKQDLQNNVIRITILIVVYRVLLDYVYSKLISRYAYYEGFIFTPSMSLGVVSWVVLILSLMVIKPIYLNKQDKISAFVVYVLYLISFVPFTTMIYAGCFSFSYIIANCVYWFLLMVFENYFVGKRALYKVKFNNSDYVINPRIILFIGLSMVLLVVYISFRYTGFKISLNLYNVYSIREQNIQYSLPTIVQYLFEWAKALAPIFLAYCLFKKSYISATMYFIVLLLSAGIDGTKTTLLMPFITVLCVMAYDKLPKEKESIFVTIGMIILCIISIFENLIMKTYVFAHIVLRRMLFTPNIISSYYYDFFTGHTPDFFRSSFLRHFGFVSPYTQGGKRIGEYIADIYYYRTGVNFNNGLISDAICNLGIVGIIIMPFLLVMVLRLFDNCSDKIDKIIIISLVLYLVTNLVGSFLTTMLLTHGLLAVIVILSLLNNSKDFKSNYYRISEY